MTAKDVLNSCRNASREITAIQRQIDMIHIPGGPSGSKGIIITDMPHGTNDPTAAALQAVEKYETLLTEAKQRNAAILAEFEMMMKTVGDCMARIILRNYYGVGKTDQEISDEMDRARETITRRRNRAENYLQKTYVPSQTITCQV